MRSSVGPRHARRPVPTLVRGIYLPRSMDAGAFAMTTYGIPLLVLATTHSAALTGVAFALEWMPRLGAFAVAGAMVDRHGTTRVLRLASALRAIVVLAAALALPQLDAGPATTVTVMVLAASTGVLTEFSYIAAETAGGIASREAGERAHRVQSVLLGIDQVGTLAGPAIAGLLLERTGAAGMLATIAVFSLLACALAPRQHATKTELPQPLLAGLRTGWTTLRSLPALGWLVCGLTLSNLAIGLLQAAAPVIVVQQFGHSSADVGLIWSVAALASLITVAVCRRAIDRFGLWPVGALSATVAASACLAVSLTHTYTAYLVLIAVLMAGEGGMTVVLRTLRSHLIPQQVFGATLSLTILLLLLPFPLAGVLVATVPPALLGHVITICAAVQALGLCLAFLRLRTLPALHARLA
ncbi:MFS transporter [Streptomyces sp. WAC 01529]|uniref:MFS transporter n=1 Tax=Streptomyces sp. WAC 01529 TaxID=2203205 RepID=UPI000F6CD9E8|nr:MFS transporter [Streptomyces sp. WAC 01529]AZM56363.1 MFS transporter [Streptomyces sp. WAC 01529]